MSAEHSEKPGDVARRVAGELQARVDKVRGEAPPVKPPIPSEQAPELEREKREQAELDLALAKLEAAGWVCLPPPEPLDLAALDAIDAMEADMPPLLCMTCACRIANGTFHTAAGDAPHRPDVPALGPDGKCSHCGAQGQALDGDDLDG